MDIIENAKKAKQRMTLDLKDNLIHQLMAARCPVRIDTLKERAWMISRYSDFDDALNELIKEDKITLHFIGDGELYLSGNK